MLGLQHGKLGFQGFYVKIHGRQPRVYHYYSILNAWAIESSHRRAAMTVSVDDLSDNAALWRFSLAFYARPGVSEALIALQDRAGCDVNLMLFALWLGVSGGNRLTKEELAIASRIARPISADIVEPLRALRRKLSSDPDADAYGLREGIKELELAAEKVIQDRLGRIARPAFGDIDDAARAAAGHANLALYLGPELSSGTEATTIAEALEVFLRV